MHQITRRLSPSIIVAGIAVLERSPPTSDATIGALPAPQPRGLLRAAR
jgi:hypothetical protein